MKGNEELDSEERGSENPGVGPSFPSFRISVVKGGIHYLMSKVEEGKKRGEYSRNDMDF